MTEIRINRLRELIKTKFENSISKLAAALGQNPSYFSDVLGGRKAFAEKKVRQMETALGLEPLYFDRDASGQIPVVTQNKNIWPFDFPKYRWDRLQVEQRKEISNWVQGRITMFESEALDAARKKKREAERSQRS